MAEQITSHNIPNKYYFSGNINPGKVYSRKTNVESKMYNPINQGKTRNNKNYSNTNTYDNVNSKYKNCVLIESKNDDGYNTYKYQPTDKNAQFNIPKVAMPSHLEYNRYKASKINTDRKSKNKINIFDIKRKNTQENFTYNNINNITNRIEGNHKIINFDDSNSTLNKTDFTDRNDIHKYHKVSKTNLKHNNSKQESKNTVLKVVDYGSKTLNSRKLRMNNVSEINENVINHSQSNFNNYNKNVIYINNNNNNNNNNYNNNNNNINNNINDNNNYHNNYGSYNTYTTNENLNNKKYDNIVVNNNQQREFDPDIDLVDESDDENPNEKRNARITILNRNMETLKSNDINNNVNYNKNTISYTSNNNKNKSKNKNIGKNNYNYYYDYINKPLIKENIANLNEYYSQNQDNLVTSEAGNLGHSTNVTVSHRLMERKKNGKHRGLISKPNPNPIRSFSNSKMDSRSMERISYNNHLQHNRNIIHNNNRYYNPKNLLMKSESLTDKIGINSTRMQKNSTLECEKPLMHKLSMYDRVTVVSRRKDKKENRTPMRNLREQVNTEPCEFKVKQKEKCPFDKAKDNNNFDTFNIVRESAFQEKLVPEKKTRRTTCQTRYKKQPEVFKEPKKTVKNLIAVSKPGADSNAKEKKNQDTYVCLRNINGIDDFNIFGVLDGHGPYGDEASKISSEFITSFITNNDKIKNSFDLNQIYDIFKSNNYELIHQAYKLAEENLRIKGSKFNESGTTCVITFQIGTHLICGNTGDSRAIFVYDESPNGNSNSGSIILPSLIPLSKDHKPRLPEEEKRINSLGGEVDECIGSNGEKNGPPRVWEKGKEYPGLAMSRSIGDCIATKIGVIPDPDVIEYTLDEQSKFLIICSDGIWEFLSNEDVMNYSLTFYKKNNPNALCSDLIKRSTAFWKSEGNEVDDITVIAVFY